MALEVHWYGYICFGIVALSILVTLYLLQLKDKESNSKCERLLVSSGVDDEFSNCRGHVSYSNLWRSCWKGLHPGWLLGFRIFAVVILCGFLAWDIQEWGVSIFYYYTEWTFSLVIVYFVIGTVISAHGCVLHHTRKKHFPTDFEGGEDLLKDVEQNIIGSSENGGERGNNWCNRNQQSQVEIEERAGFWGYLMQTLYQTCAGAVILTDVVFWVLIVPFLSIAHLQVDSLMASMHSINAVFLLLDTSLNNLPFPWFRLGYFVLWSCSYVIFQWIIHACGLDWWPYPFLDMSTPVAPFWYFCMAAVHIPCYWIFSLFTKAKNSTFSYFSPHQFMKC